MACCAPEHLRWCRRAAAWIDAEITAAVIVLPQGVKSYAAAAHSQKRQVAPDTAMFAA
jgi:hypothetical protein